MGSYRKDKTGSAQTAANASAVLVSAFADCFDSFKDATEAYHQLREAIFEDLSVVVDADNAVFEAAENGSSNGSSKGSSSRKSSGSSRSSKTGGGSKRRSGGGSVSLDDALDLELNFGSFKGETLGFVLGLSADACDADYAYGDRERDGRDYISWLAGGSNKNEFVQKRARVIADEEGIEYDD